MLYFCRWRIVIHGAIDGFSKHIMFLEASDNNCRTTVAQLIMTAANRFGLPSHIRVGTIMEDVCGPDKGISRSGVDLWNDVCNLYYNLFQYMESSGLLDIDNGAQMWALHYTFLPRIRRDLQGYVTQWNTHGVSVKGHTTPAQVYAQRSRDLSLTNSLAVYEVVDQLNKEWKQEDTPPTVVTCPITEEQLGEMKRRIDPLDDGQDNLGIDNYMRVLRFVTDYMVMNL